MTQASEELLRLAERCEKAVFPCPDDASATEVVEIRSAICQLITGRPYGAYSPDYIGSLDAAMSLVPEGWLPLLDSTDAGESRHYAELYGPTDAPADSSCAPTLALALCAAALRALANKATPHG